MMNDTGALRELCREWKIDLNEQQLAQFVRFFEMLVEKNKVMNLTAITDWDEVVSKHFIDSLSLVRALPLSSLNLTLLDLGTGAGFPGIPLKIAFPDLQVTLVDSLGKRVRFLQEVIEGCSLDGICAIHARAEDLARLEEHREHYDLCVSRAVANLSTLSEYCLPFVRVGGSFIAYKGARGDAEMRESKAAIRLLGGKPLEEKGVTRFTLPGAGEERMLIRIEKEKKTPSRYPRKAGTPSKEPL